MGKSKDLWDFDKNQIVMNRRLGQSISKMAGLVGCSQYTVVSKYLPKVFQGRTTGDKSSAPKAYWCTWEIKASLADPEPQIVEKCNAGNLQRPSGVHASRGQSSFVSMRRTYTVLGRWFHCYGGSVYVF